MRKLLSRHEGKCSDSRERNRKKPPRLFRFLFRLLELASMVLKILQQAKDLFGS